MDKKNPALNLQLDLKDFFKEKVVEALNQKKIEIKPVVQTYLVDLLHFYSVTDHLYDDVDERGKKQRPMLAEMLLQAGQCKDHQRKEILKKLGDKSLYVSGFFSASLNRKIIDVDYYIEMGATAYGMLSSEAREDTYNKLYSDIAHRFLELVDVLGYISERSFVAPLPTTLRLMELYAKTGLPGAGEALVERGVYNLHQIASSTGDEH